MKVWCKKCSLDMGEITKSKMRKGWICLCSDCYFKMKLADDAMQGKKSDGLNGLGPLGDIFK